MRTMEELESILGPPRSFILEPDMISTLKEWAIVAGFDRLTISAMTDMELAKMYHRFGGSTIRPEKNKDCLF